MEMKLFAKSTESVSQLGFGCWGIGKSAWVGAEDTESLNSLLKAIEQGVTLFDTAYVYGDGHSEKLVGAAEKESGKKIFIASKIPSKKYEWPARPESTLAQSFPESHIIEMTEKSLKNLKREYLDLQQFHVWNDSWATQDEWKNAVMKPKQQGKVRYFGISINDHQADNGIKAAESGLIDCFQVIFNLFDQSPIDKLFPFCKKNKISVLARVPFDEGGLTGAVTKDTVFPKGDFRNNYFSGDRKEQVATRVTKIQQEVGAEAESLSAAALRFVLSFDEVTSVIPGMRNQKHLLDNVRAAQQGSLSADLVSRLRAHAWERNFYS